MTCEAPSGYGKGRGTLTAHSSAPHDLVTIRAQDRVIERLQARIAELEHENALQKDVILGHQPAIDRLHAVIEAMNTRIRELEARRG